MLFRSVMSDEKDRITKTPPKSFEGKVRTPEKIEAVRKLARYDEKAKAILERVRRKDSKSPKQSSDITPLLIGLTALVLFLRYITHHQEAAPTSAVGMQ